MHAASVFVDDRSAAKLLVRGGRRISRAHTLAFEFRGSHLHVRAHFVAQIAIEVARAPLCPANFSYELQYPADAETE